MAQKFKKSFWTNRTRKEKEAWGVKKIVCMSKIR